MFINSITPRLISRIRIGDSQRVHVKLYGNESVRACAVPAHFLDTLFHLQLNLPTAAKRPATSRCSNTGCWMLLLLCFGRGAHGDEAMDFGKSMLWTGIRLLTKGDDVLCQQSNLACNYTAVHSWYMQQWCINFWKIFVSSHLFASGSRTHLIRDQQCRPSELLCSTPRYPGRYNSSFDVVNALQGSPSLLLPRTEYPFLSWIRPFFSIRPHYQQKSQNSTCSCSVLTFITEISIISYLNWTVGKILDSV